MENMVAAVELGSNKIKIVIGYELDGKVYSVYSTTRPLGQLLQTNGFFDVQKLLNTVNSIKDLKDPNVNMSYKIDECVICLPPDGLEIYQKKQGTAVISEHKKVSPIDIKNVYMIIKNGIQKTGNLLVDIIPEDYFLDDKQVLNPFPIGENCTNLILNAKVHLLPETIYNNYVGIMEKAHIQVKRTVVASLAATEYLGTVKDAPQSCLLVDIGAENTSVSLVGKGALFGTQRFAWGGDCITKAIAAKFNVSFEDAEKYKKIYGIDEREMHFKAPICSYGSTPDQTVNFYKDDLNAIIIHELNEYIAQLSKAIDTLLAKQNPELKKLPIVLVGGGSQLKGLVNYMSDKVSSNLIKVVTPTTIGARDSTYLNCLGMILVANKYVSLIDDKQIRISGMTRE